MDTPIPIENLPKFTGLDEESAENYYSAKISTDILNSYVINPFKEKLKENTGYSKDNIPEETEISDIILGPHKFQVVNEKRKKKPQSEKVYSDFIGYLEFLQQQHEEGIKRKDIFTIDEEAYAPLEYIIDRARFLLKKEEDIKQTIKYPSLSKYLDTIIVPIEEDILLNEAGASLYLNSDFMVKYMKKNVISPLENTLKSQTGYTQDNIPTEVNKKKIQIGQHLFKLTIGSKKTIKYAKVLDTLYIPSDKEKGIEEKGELVDLRALNPDEKINEFYKPSKRAGIINISLPGTLQRINHLTEKQTSTGLNISPLKHNPVPTLKHRPIVQS